MPMVLLVGEVLTHRSFNGANKSLPVLASGLHNAGYDSVQLDLERPDVRIDEVLNQAAQADLVAFAGCMTPQWPELDHHLHDLCAHLARAGKGDTPVIVGGYATKGVEDVARKSPWITGFFNGEGEDGIVELAEWAAGGRSLKRLGEIEGVCFVDESNRWHFSLSTRRRHLDEIDQNFGFTHVPEVHDMSIFLDQNGRQCKTGQLYTQRGCPWSCSFCNKSTESNAVARMSDEAIREQLRAMRDDGYEAIYLDVDTFNVNKAAALREARILAEEGFIWGSNTRIDTVDAAFIKEMVDNKCVYMFFGVEHTDPGVLLAINKFNGSLTAQLRKIEEYRAKIKQVFKEMAQVCLPSSYFLILGLPKAVLSQDGSIIVSYRPASFEEDAEAIRFGLENCEPDYLNFNMLRFMPGSAAADIPDHPAYSCVRPSNGNPITAGYFLPRVADLLGYEVSRNHGVYRLCESVGHNQPTTTGVDAQRVYDSVKYAVDLINARTAGGCRPTRLFIDTEIQNAGLCIIDDDGLYRLAPLSAFESL
jgi:anaerobic magnesium-protoporphyrin IX monomethyl ester cyclase